MRYTPNAALREAAIRLMASGLVTCAEVSRSLKVSRVTANKWGQNAPNRVAARKRVITGLFAKEVKTKSGARPVEVESGSRVS